MRICATGVRCRYLEHLDIVVLHVFESRCERTEVLLVLLLTRGGDGGQRAAMERADRRDYHREGDAQLRVSVFAGQFNGSFVRLCTRVAEEGLQYYIIWHRVALIDLIL